MAPRRTTKSQGFSLYELSDPISQAVEILTDALESQGVTVQKDDLFLQIQSVVKTVGNGYGASGYGMMASDDTRAPYSIAGDFLAIAYQNYEAGDKKAAITAFLEAAASEDFSEIANGLLEMNQRSEIQKKITANENEDLEDSDLGEEEKDDDNDETTEEEDEDNENDDLTDEEIEELIEDSNTNRDNTFEAEDKVEVPTVDKKKEVNTETKEQKKEDEEDETAEEETKTKAPMGGTSSEVTASLEARILANKLSLDGSPESRKKAKLFVKDNPRLGA